jgi:hypothetical protein
LLAKFSPIYCAFCIHHITHRRCRFLKPPGSSSCPLLLFDPFAGSSQLLSASGLARCISLAGNNKAAVQQLMSQGVLHAQRLAAAGAFAALPLKAEVVTAAAAAAAEESVPQLLQQQVDGAADLLQMQVHAKPQLQQQQQHGQNQLAQQAHHAGPTSDVEFVLDAQEARQRGGKQLDMSSHADVVDINAVAASTMFTDY